VSSRSEERNTNPKDIIKKNVSTQDERLVNTWGKKNRDKKQPFGRDHKNNIFLESFKRFHFFVSYEATGKLKQVR